MRAFFLAATAALFLFACSCGPAGAQICPSCGPAGYPWGSGAGAGQIFAGNAPLIFGQSVPLYSSPTLAGTYAAPSGSGCTGGSASSATAYGGFAPSVGGYGVSAGVACAPLSPGAIMFGGARPQQQAPVVSDFPGPTTSYSLPPGTYQVQDYPWPPAVTLPAPQAVTYWSPGRLVVPVRPVVFRRIVRRSLGLPVLVGW